MGSARDVAAPAPLVRIQGFVGEGVHDCPGDVGVAGGVGTRCAVSDLAAAGGAALDGQECLGDVGPSRIPLDTAPLNRVLCLKHQSVFGLQAVVNRCCPRVEVAHQVKHAVANTRGVDADVLDVESLGEFFDLLGLVLE